MIICEKTQDVIDLYINIGQPLSEELVDSLKEIQQELINDGIAEKWVIFETKCRICNYEQVTIVPAVADLDNLECDNCENMSAMEKEDPEWLQSDKDLEGS